MMKTQMFVLLSALCMLTFTPPVCLQSVNTTDNQITANSSDTTTKATVQTIAKTSIPTSSLSTKQLNTVIPKSSGDNNGSLSKTILLRILVILMVVVLLVLACFAYKWFSQHPEQRSINGLQRSIAQSIRTARAAAILERLRPSRKQKEDENEMERGMTQDDEQERLETGKDDKEDDSSNDFNSIDGSTTMMQVKKEEVPTDDSSTSSEEEDDAIKPDDPEEEKAEEA